jgi:predicted transcriptional regulator
MAEAGLNQTEVSEVLGISQAAVSHYFSDKRGDATVLDRHPDVAKLVQALGEDLSNGMAANTRIERICVICKKLRDRVIDESRD